MFGAIQDLQPHIYDVFVLNDQRSLEKLYPNLHLFLNDIRVYFLTYTVITTYFKRSSRTTICNYVADQILFFIFKTYFDPIIKEGDKGAKKLKTKNSKFRKDFSKENLLNSLSNYKKNKLKNLIELPELTRDNLLNKEIKLKEKSVIENFIIEISYTLEKNKNKKI